MATALGRLGTIINAIQILLNNEAGIAPDQFSEEELIILFNLCTYQLAEADTWKKTDTFSITAGTPSYDLAALLSDFMHSFGFRYVGSSSSYTYQLKPFRSWNQYQNCLSVCETGTPRCYWLQNRTLYLYPTPDATESNAIQSVYSYLPTDFDATGQTSYTPALPENTPYIWYGCWKICEKFSDDDRALQKMAYYQDLYTASVKALSRKQVGPRTMAPPQ